MIALGILLVVIIGGSAIGATIRERKRPPHKHQIDRTWGRPWRDRNRHY